MNKSRDSTWIIRHNRFNQLALTLMTFLLATVQGGCHATQPEVSRPHHSVDGFRNNYSHDRHGFSDFLKWRLDRLLGRRPDRAETGAYHFPLAQNDPEYLQDNGHETTVTWIGHASLLLQIDGINILTDPHLTERASPLSWAGPKRVVPPGLTFEDLPVIHMVLISHNHYDHLDLPTLQRLSRQWSPKHHPRIFVPLGGKRFLEGKGLSNVVEMDWWDQENFRGLTIHAVPAQHFSSRTPFDRNTTLWAGYVLLNSRFRFYFAGDTGYSPDFTEIGRRLGPMDLAAIPIGAYEPRWFMRAMHLNPEEAVLVHQDVQSRRSVGIHWGTFNLTDEPMDEPPKRLRAALLEASIPLEEFFVMQHGETRRLTPSGRETSLPR